MMHIARIGLLSVSLTALGLSFAACGGTVAAEPNTAQSAAALAPVGVATHGPVKFVGEALGEVSMRPEQRAELEQLATAAEARHEATRAARKDLMDAIAAQVESGKIDRAALQPKIDAAAQALDSVRPGDRAAFERMHAILDGAQRAKFVEALEAKFKAKHGDNSNPRHAMKEWATELKLTDAQKDQIKATLRAEFHKGKGKDGHMGGHHAMEHGKKALEAFKAERFVLEEVAPAAAAEKAQQMSGRFLGVAESILPLLTPEQRTIAATKLRTFGAATDATSAVPGL